MKALAITLLLGLTFGCAASQRGLSTIPETARDSRAAIDGELAQRIGLYLEQASVSGFSGSVLIARDDGVLLHQGYGWADRDRHAPVAAETPFWVASVAKQFTAAAILKLAEQGKVAVGDPVAEYLDEVPEEKRGITLHQLLTHTAGLGQNYAADGIAGRGEAIRAILAEPLKHPPGERFAYSNDGYNLLAAIVEIASGESYESYLQRNLFEPAGLTRTGFWGHADGVPVAQIHGEVSAQNQNPNWGFRGATGIYSTTGDLHRWHQALGDARVLSAFSRGQLFSPHVALGRLGHYGYGWFISPTARGTTSVWTRGNDDFGHNAILTRYPEEKITVVVASNAGDSEGVPVSRKVAEEVSKIIFRMPGER